MNNNKGATIGINECCQNQNNLELSSDDHTSSGQIRVFKCRVCGRRHFIFSVAPIEIAVTEKK